MIASFSLCIISIFLPPLIYCLISNKKENLYYLYPLSLLLHWLLTALATTILISFHTDPIIKFLIVETISLLVIQTYLKSLGKIQGIPSQNYRALIFIFLVALGSVSDCFYLFNIPEIFRLAPFSNDAERNLILLQSIGDNLQSPFLAESKLIYQIFWHLSMTPLWHLLPKENLHSSYSGLIIANSFLFYFLTYWALSLICSRLLKNKVYFIFIAVLLSTHSEIYYYILSLFKTGYPQFEGNWSVSFPVFYRFISFKLLTLTSPQHTLFFSGLLCFIAAINLTDFKTRLTLLAGMFFLSPLFFIFSLPLLAWFFYANKKPIRELFSLLFLPFIYFLLGFSPSDLISTKRSDLIWFFPFSAIPFPHFLFFPLILFGVLGLVFYLNYQTWLKNKFIFIYFILTLFISHFLVTNAEIRRHATIYSLFLLLYIISKSTPSFLDRKFSKTTLWLSTTTIGLSLFLHQAFIRSYSELSYHSHKIETSDYIKLGAYLKKNKPHQHVLTGIFPEIGINFSPLHFYAPCFQSIPSALVHSKLSKKQWSLLKQSENFGSVLPLAGSLGYSLIVWGPIEELSWPTKVKNRFISNKNLIHREGTVSLYLYKDLLLKDISDPIKKSFLLKKEGFINESDYYKTAATLRAEDNL